MILRREKPLLSWDTGKGRMVNDKGDAVTKAQELKVRAYLNGDKIRCIAKQSRDGETVYTLRLAPLRGCHQDRIVKVHVRRLGTKLYSVRYECDCQKFVGTSSTPPGQCSHVTAAARYYNQKGGLL